MRTLPYPVMNPVTGSCTPAWFVPCWLNAFHQLKKTRLLNKGLQEGK